MRRLLATLCVLSLSSLTLSSGSYTSLETIGVPVIELNADTFREYLSQDNVLGDRCLIEYYALWCPHCQHYKNTYEKIGKFFNYDPRPRPTVWVARVDCAEKKNIELCDEFKITGYPTIFFAETKKFLHRDLDKLKRIPAQDPEGVVQQISNYLGENIKYEERNEENTASIISRQKAESHLDIGDIERSTVELFERLLQSSVILNSLEARAALEDFVELLSVAHPSTRCRHSFLYLLAELDVLWPKTSESPNYFLSKFKVCTVEYKTREWRSCAGSIAGTRGFTCGLWQLLHALTAGIKDREVDIWKKGVLAFAEYFFGCEECAVHFIKHLESPLVQRIESKSELIMWLWRAHNIVNNRLQREEKVDKTGDPAFPKIQWPSAKLCAACHTEYSTDSLPDWNEQAVLEFLTEFYSPSQSKKEKEFARLSRKEMEKAINALLTPLDIFPKEDATAFEMNKPMTGNGLSALFILVMVAIVIVIVRKSGEGKPDLSKDF